MKYILLILLIATLASCKKDNTIQVGKSIYTTWYIAIDGTKGIAYIGNSSRSDSVLITNGTCHMFSKNLYNVKTGDLIMASSDSQTCTPGYRQSTTIGAIRSDGSRIIFKTDTAPSTASTVVQVSYIVKE